MYLARELTDVTLPASAGVRRPQPHDGHARLQAHRRAASPTDREAFDAVRKLTERLGRHRRRAHADRDRRD